MLCGRAGARLWPASRGSRPKQFISLFGNGSTFQSALQRVAGSPLFSRPLVLARDEHRFLLVEQLPDISLTADVMLELARRDSAAAIAAATVHVARKDPTAILLTLAASFRVCVEAAADRLSSHGAVHRLANPGKILLELIAVQVGSYTGEDDIVRIDDVYGRG